MNGKWTTSPLPLHISPHLETAGFPAPPACLMSRGQRPHPPRLTYLSQCTLRFVRVLQYVTPWGSLCHHALNEPPPTPCSLRGGSFQAAPTLNANSVCVSSSQPSSQGSVPKLPLPKAQCNCPVIVHSSTAQRVEEGGGSKELWALNIQEIVIWQWASY